MTKSLLEQKIIYFLKNISTEINMDDLELIKASVFDEDGKLKIIDPNAKKEMYLKYWREIIAKSD